MLAPDFRYIAQDTNLNGSGYFLLSLHWDILSSTNLHTFNLSVRYEDFEGGIAAKYYVSSPQLAAIIHCKSKIGSPQILPKLRFLYGGRMEVSWPQVSRIFVRIRIMEYTSLEVLSSILLDDIQSGHSLSDIDEPERNQTIRPWSDEEDSESETLPHHI
jgi:hypothetical protein